MFIYLSNGLVLEAQPRCARISLLAEYSLFDVSVSPGGQSVPPGAFDLSLRGLSLRQIGAELDVSYVTVKRDLDSYMEQLVSPKAERLRLLYTGRYERMLALLDPKVAHGDLRGDQHRGLTNA